MHSNCLSFVPMDWHRLCAVISLLKDSNFEIAAAAAG